jgi:8-oxo-dGTP pyrophosphatase MutT (NUDIX family)
VKYIIDFHQFILEGADDDKHRVAMEETGYWGRKGAGCLFLARSTGRICFAYRNARVAEGDCYGTFGGAIDSGEDPKAAAIREALEEVGARVRPGDMKPLMVYKDGDFRYYNYIAVVDEEFEMEPDDPDAAWETDYIEWVGFGQWPSPLHHGVEALLNDKKSLDIIHTEIGKLKL